MPVQATLQGSADVKPASIQRLAGGCARAGEERAQATHRRRPRRALGVFSEVRNAAGVSADC